MTPKEAQKLAHNMASYYYDMFLIHGKEKALKVACYVYCAMFDAAQELGNYYAAFKVQSEVISLFSEQE